MSLRFSKRGGHEVTEAEKKQIVLSGRCVRRAKYRVMGLGRLALRLRSRQAGFLYFFGGEISFVSFLSSNADILIYFWVALFVSD